MAVLANGCEGGWIAAGAARDHRASPSSRARSIGVQNGSIGLVSLMWKLKHEGLEAARRSSLFLDNQDQPVPLAARRRGGDLLLRALRRASPS